MRSAEFEGLRRVSARIGNDPLLVQGAGGNTSIKQDGVMWIKASGTWLKDAEAKDIFVPLDLQHLSEALAKDDPACESCTDFVRSDLNPGGLRPSIETSVHGLMPQRVVMHVHCVNTIAFAVQNSGEALIGQRLKAFNWAYVPYARPGLMLSRAITSVLRPGVDVLILGNHGLAVAADTVAEAEALLERVVEAVQLPVRGFAKPDLAALERTARGTSYRPPEDLASHDIALDEWSYAHGGRHVYYPDHVVFLGTEIPDDLSSNAVVIAVPGKGVLIHRDAKPSVEPMVRCIGEVFRRLIPGDILKALTAAEIDQLVNWDAEKYRQTLKA